MRLKKILSVVFFFIQILFLIPNDSLAVCRMYLTDCPTRYLSPTIPGQNYLCYLKQYIYISESEGWDLISTGTFYSEEYQESWEQTGTGCPEGS